MLHAKSIGGNIDAELGMGLAYFNKGNSIGDSAAKGIGEQKNGDTREAITKKYEEPLRSFEEAINCDNSRKKILRATELMNIKLCSRYIANTRRCQGFVHAKIAENTRDSEIGTKQREHIEAFKCFRNSTENEEDSLLCITWNSRGYHIIGFLEDLKYSFERKPLIKEAMDFFEDSFKNVYFEDSFKIDKLIDEAMDFFDKAIECLLCLISIRLGSFTIRVMRFLN